MTPEKRRLGFRIPPLNTPRRLIPDGKKARRLNEDINWNKEDLLQLKADEIAHGLLEATSTSPFSAQIIAACQTKPFKTTCYQLAQLDLNPDPRIPLRFPTLVKNEVLTRMFNQGEPLTLGLVQQCREKVTSLLGRTLKPNS